MSAIGSITSLLSKSAYANVTRPGPASRGVLLGYGTFGPDVTRVQVCPGSATDIAQANVSRHGSTEQSLGWTTLNMIVAAATMKWNVIAGSPIVKVCLSPSTYEPSSTWRPVSS